MAKARRWWTYFGWLLGILLLVIVIIIAVLYVHTTTLRHHSQTIQAPHGKVSVQWSTDGIPTITSEKSDLDVFYALGYVHAQDRLWQMEIQRRVARGTLAAILGPKALKMDEYARTWGFYRAAKAAWPALSSQSKAIIKSYTAGVNAYIKHGKLPLPFVILGYRPDPWTNIDSISWAKMMSWDLQNNWQEKLRNYLLTRRFGHEQFHNILYPYPKKAPTILSESDLLQSSLLKSPFSMPIELPRQKGKPASKADEKSFADTLKTAQQIRHQLNMSDAPGKGSNNWVVSGKLTKTGKPILANDPHLTLAAPSVWYLAELKGPKLHVVGASFPGLPAIVIGHNEHIAWGVTNSEVDAQDLYVLPTNAPMKILNELIQVRGKPDVHFKVRLSHYGPVISTVTDTKKISDYVAIRWPALMPGDTTVMSFEKIDYAQNWKQFVHALTYFVAPSQNFVYADTKGNIGYYLPGKIPVRQGWDGAFPIMLNENKKWAGYIPFKQLPHVFNPKKGYIASANNKIVPDNYPYKLTYRWKVAPYRIARIDDLIEQNEPLSVHSMEQIQGDVKSGNWMALRKILLATKPRNKTSEHALHILMQWNGRMDVDSIGATIYAYWWRELNKMVPKEAMLNQSFSVPLFVKKQLANQGAYCKALGANNCDQFKSITLAKAMASLRKDLGVISNDWQWGRVHKAKFVYAALGNAKSIGWLWNREISTPGGDYTVNVGTYDPQTFHQVVGPSYRQIVDLSDFNHSRFIITLGQSENPLTKHYQDQMLMWRNVQYLKMLF